MKTEKLGDICSFAYGESLPSHSRGGAEYPVFGSNGLVGHHGTSLTDGQTIIIGRKGSIGKVHLSPQGCWPIDTTYYIDRSTTNCSIHWLYFLLQHLKLDSLNRATGVPGLNREDAYRLQVGVPEDINEQERIASDIRCKMDSVESAIASSCVQLKELLSLANSIINASLRTEKANTPHLIGNVLDEVKFGIGSSWREFKVLGATRSGLALAREQPGKNAASYKLVDAGTVFYNPMRILIGSIAFVDEDDEPGITSPDYVVLKGKPGVVDSRWFYYWLRSPLGERCIQSLARGAVRERMLFNRLAEGEIELPNYDAQVKASQALAKIKPMRQAIQQQLKELELLPQKLLSQVFDS